RQLCPRLMKYIVPYWEVLALSLTGMMVMAATTPMIAALAVPMLDGALVNKDMESMQLVLLAVIVLFTARGAAGYISTYAINWLGSKLAVDLRAEMFNKLLALPACYYADQPDSNLVSRLTFDITQLVHAVVDAITVMVKDAFAVIGLLGWMLYLNWKLSVPALLMTSVILLIMRSFSKRLQGIEREARETVDSINQVVKEAIENHKVVRLYGGQRYETRRMGEEAGRVHSFTVRQAAVAAFSVPLVQLSTAIALAILLYLAARQASANEITVGGFVSVILAMLLLSAPLKRIAGVNVLWRRGLPAADSIFSLLDQETEPDAGTIAINRARGELQFEHVSFRHSPAISDQASLNADPALRDITLTIRPGEMVALVGLSERDKAALANLVPRFFHPTEGRVLLDGHDLASLTLNSLRANIALVSQETALFNDTVAANIAYGDMGRETESKITAAAQSAHAMEFIREMPQGLQTMVGERGIKFSGGQRLRIAVARALLRNSPVVILDETFETLDFKSAHHEQAAVEVLVQGRTTLVIAHRLSTVEKASRVVVLQKGRITETGGHRELLAKNGTYARIVRTFV
ncbi:MAG: lipid A export permease/ATP-binding protein MsbA, partial [Nitrosospira sp.]|nr:lipid A export permease/ATP-binding protein MsbA [Nitrosospira sp.]